MIERFKKSKPKKTAEHHNQMPMAETVMNVADILNVNNISVLRATVAPESITQLFYTLIIACFFFFFVNTVNEL